MEDTNIFILYHDNLEGKSDKYLFALKILSGIETSVAKLGGLRPLIMYLNMIETLSGIETGLNGLSCFPPCDLPKTLSGIETRRNMDRLLYS